MRWEELTSDEFTRATVDCGGVCLISMGSLERHGPHMPLGTDMLNGQHICERAAAIEPAVVFPPWYLGQINEARCYPGTVALPPKMLVELLLGLLDEIGRNGFTRIIIYIAHGGNIFLAKFLAQCQLFQRKPYQVYAFNYSAGMTAEEKAAWEAVLTPGGGGHAGESETSVLMAHRPELLKMDALGKLSGERQARMDHVRDGVNALWWYADYPENMTGKPELASAEKGGKLLDILAATLARYVRAVKDDTVTPALAEEFFRREQSLRGDG
jgi:creatinine amidohydrolase